MAQSSYAIEFIKSKFSSNKTSFIAKQLNIHESTVRRIAKQYNLVKDEEFLCAIRKKCVESRKRSYESNLKNYTLSQIQKNIIIGSILGDGSIALYGRSRNAYYREHGCDKQRGYRAWKRERLASLDFEMDNSGKLHSPSHPIYTDLYGKFYNNMGEKYLCMDNISLLDHPIGLACLYMDDGSLVIDSSYGIHKKYIFPRISIYTLCFSLEENELLSQHIERTFNIKFKLKKRQDGKNYLLELNRRNSVLTFLEIVQPYVSEIPCMSYKIDLDERMRIAEWHLSKPDKQIMIRSRPIANPNYSLEDEMMIISLDKQGKTDKEIAMTLNHSYWGVVDKIRRMRETGKI